LKQKETGRCDGTNRALGQLTRGRPLNKTKFTQAICEERRGRNPRGKWEIHSLILQVLVEERTIEGKGLRNEGAEREHQSAGLSAEFGIICRRRGEMREGGDTRKLPWNTINRICICLEQDGKKKRRMGILEKLVAISKKGNKLKRFAQS